MSNIDEDEILELEISDNETFGLHGVGSPGKKRRVAGEVPEVVSSAERTITLLPNSMVSLQKPLVPEKLSFAQYALASSSSASRVNTYRSRIPLVYPELVSSDSSPVRTEATERTTMQRPTTTLAFSAWSKKISIVVQLSLGHQSAFLDQPLFDRLSTSLGTIVSAENLPKTT